MSYRRAIEQVALKFSGVFKITLEDRPLAVLASSSGDRIRGASSGTVGGFLRDSSGTIYGTTCSHVAASGSVSDSRGATLGTVAHASKQTPRPTPHLCRPRGTTLNDMDASIYTSTGGASACRFAGPTIHYGSGQASQMQGATSGGPHTFYLGGLGLVQTLHHNGNDYCFENLFSIRPRPTAPLPISAAIAFAPVPAQGDSGAWITVGGTGTQREWIGMLIGVDLVEGFALDATDVLAWAAKAAGASLSIW
jgi:hypothetical protein